ncbi:MAG TPA: hypothetical protein VHY08_04405 [Bacillota bacterium]|nr:hypothetical protein [Bacillota bacterium]
MRIDNNLGGINILEEQARAREIKTTQSTPKVKNSRSNQRTESAYQAPNFEFSSPAALESKPQMAEIINFEEAQKIFKDTKDQALGNPNELIFAQAHNKPETILKLIS